MEAGLPPARSLSVDATSSDCSSPGPSASEVAASDVSTVQAAAASVNGPSQLLDISSDRGPAGGGTVVWVQGTNLSGAVRVLFGECAAVDISVCSGELLKCKSPAYDLRGASERTVQVRLARANEAGAGATSLPFTYFAVKGGGGRKRVDPAGAMDGAEEESAAGERVDEQALKVRLVSVIQRIDGAPGGVGGAGSGVPADGSEHVAERSARLRRAFLAARDDAGWGVLHLLAVSEWLPLLAFALFTAGCPTTHRTHRGASPLQVALAHDRRAAARMLALFERREGPDWRAVWVATPEVEGPGAEDGEDAEEQAEVGQEAVATERVAMAVAAEEARGAAEATVAEDARVAA